MFKKFVVFYSALVFLLLFSCSTIPKSNNQLVKQGIEGFIGKLTGNQMPSPDIPPAKPNPLATTIYIYALTNMKDVQKATNAAFYKQINTRLITTAQSDSTGKFLIGLPAGSYSLFIKKGNFFYANQFDEKNNIFPVTVDSMKLSKANFIDNSDASF